MPKDIAKTRKEVLETASEVFGIEIKNLDPHCQVVESGFVLCEEPIEPYRKLIATDKKNYFVGDRCMSKDALMCHLMMPGRIGYER